MGEESSAIVVYPDTTRLEIGENTLVSEFSQAARLGGKKVLVERGSLTAEVPKQPAGKPMVLATSLAETLVLESKCSLTIMDDATYVEIETGSVQLTRKSDGASIEVDAGCGAEATNGIEPMSPHALNTARRTYPGYARALFSPDGKTLATIRGGYRGTVALWDTITGSKRTDLPVGIKPSHAAAVAFSPTGNRFAVDCRSTTSSILVKVCNVATGKMVSTLNGQSDHLSALGFSADGDTLAGIEDTSKTLIRWDLRTREPRVADSYPAKMAAFAPDGLHLATATDQAVILWDTTSGKQTGSFPLSNKKVYRSGSLVFSPNGNTLAFTGDATVIVWDVASGRVRHTCRQASWTNRSKSALALSVDGAFLAIANNNTITVRNLQTGLLRTTLRESSKVNSLSFAADGKSLAVGSGVGETCMVKIWGLE